MNIFDAYEIWASTYDSDRNLTRDLDQRVTENILSGLNCETLLELGCGTGKNTNFLSQIGKRVYSIDFSSAMIDRAKSKLTPENVNFIIADLTKPWPCENQSIDQITCNLVLEHIAELSFVFSEAHRCLAVSGRFFISELHPMRQYLGKKATF